MKKIYALVLCISILFFATSSIELTHSSQTGIIGYTGAPGSFGTCASCHGGGSASSSGITITAVPAFTNNEYMPDSSYVITVSGSAAGYGRYGFAAEILTTANQNAGTITANTAGGVKTGNMNAQRKQAIHTVPKVATIANFTFPWKAPSAGKATIYTIVNAVNGNGSTSGDFPISPKSMALDPMPVPVDTSHVDTTIDTSVGEQIRMLSAMKVFPNPASSFVDMSFYLDRSLPVQAVITDTKGRELRREQLSPGNEGSNSIRLNVSDLPRGIYILGIQSGFARLGQRMVAVE